MPGAQTANSRAATERIVQLIRTVIATDPQIRNKKDFSIASGIHQTILSRWFGRKSSCTLDDVIAVCQRFKPNPLFIILGAGEMFLEGNAGMKKTTLEQQVADINLRLSSLEIELQKSGTKSRNKTSKKSNKKRPT